MRFSAPLFLGFLVFSAAPALAEDTFSISISNGLGFDQDTRNARVKWATEEAWAFIGAGITLRVAGFRMEDEPITETTEFVGNNTGLSFKAEIDGAPMLIGCKGAEDVVGWIKRDELTQTRVSGSFEVELERCLDGYTAGPIEYDNLPIIVTGTFSVDRKDW